MLPSIPDNVNKVCLAIGLFLTGYFFITLLQKQDRYYGKIDEHNLFVDSLNVRTEAHRAKKKAYEKIADNFTKRFKSPFRFNDSAYFFASMTRSTGLESRINDSLYKLYKDYKSDADVISLMRLRLTRLQESLAAEKRMYDGYYWRSVCLTALGLILTIWGLYGLINSNEDDDNLRKLAENGQLKLYVRCQSCGQKFDSIITRGTQKDGTYNSAFCRYCYDKGEFTEPTLTMQELLNRIESIPKITPRQISKLDRWKKHHY